MNNWTSINGNYLVWWIPKGMEPNVMSFADLHGYRMDIANFDYNFPPSDGSLISWVYNQSSDTMQAINIINNLNQQWANHPGLYTYSVGHETPVNDPSYWPYVEFACRKITQLNSARRSYLVAGGTPSIGFITATPHLDVLQIENGYPFTTLIAQQYDNQQSILDGMLTNCYTPAMNLLRGKHTEWHSVIQVEHEDRNSPNPSLRRPNIMEMRAETYLALSRGARGVSSFVYGSNPNVNDPLVIDFCGLVKSDRTKYTSSFDPDGQPAFDNLGAVYNEIRPLASTLRKIRVYDAFPNTAIPPTNIAKITGISGDKIEAGVFKRIDQGADSTLYFMLVNRVCNNQDGSVSSPQAVTVSFSFLSGCREISEISSGNIWIIPNNGSFTDNLDPGKGKLYRIVTTTATWSGAKSLANNVTVCSGATLTVNPGATITFPVGVNGGYGPMLLVYGQLNAQGSPAQRITFDRIGSSGSWYGLVLSSSSTDNINYCNFNHATVGIVCNTSSATISNSTFLNNYFGIYCNPVTPTALIQYNDIENSTNSGIYLTSASPHLKGNKIKNNGLWGVFCYNYSSPRMDSNTVTGHPGAGIECEYNGSPLLYVDGYPQPLDGHNVITSNIVGIHAYVNCSPVIGGLRFGKNSVCLNSVYNISATSNCSIGAESTWWGNDPPNTNLFYLNQSTLDYTNWLRTDPNRGGLSPLIAGGINQSTPEVGPSSDSTLNVAFQDFLVGKYDESITLCLNVLIGSHSTLFVAKQALLFLGKAYEFSGRTDFISLLHSQVNPKLAGKADLGVISRELEAYWLTKAGRYSEALSIFQALRSDFSSTPEIDKFALFNIGEIYHSYLNDPVKSSEAFSSFISKYPSDPLASVAHMLVPFDTSASIALKTPVGRQVEIDQNDNKNAGPSGYALESNYPNPFNPSTQIRYSLVEAGRVSLRIYDVLGREIANLADVYQQAGRYVVTWNAKQNAGNPVSSGLYFAEIRVTNDIGEIKYLKTIRLLLLR